MSKLAILIVEDNVAVLDSLSRLLEIEGFEVMAAQDCSMALNQLSARRPDAILTDLALPGMTGLEFISQVRRDAALEKIPVVATSAHRKYYLTAALMAGADMAVHKLEGFDVILQAVKEALYKRAVH